MPGGTLSVRVCSKRTMFFETAWMNSEVTQLALLFYLSLRRIRGLRDRLSRSNLTEVSFMIVNEREALSRAMYWELKRRAPPGVPVYQQAPFQNDVWEALDGDKDDFLVYDR